MRIWGLIGVVSLAMLGCRTHTVDDCRPPCTADDQVAFAHCVASGNTTPFCEPGNRRCCARDALHCVGDLDDQTVVTTVDPATCDVFVTSDQCWPPCDAMAIAHYDVCLSDGNPNCMPGNEECCALAADCLGDLGDVTVSADGCCATTADCPTGMVCDPMFFTCMGGSSATCGDGMQATTEQCDDHNTVTEECTYGMTSCLVCDATCHQIQGAIHLCGDHVIDSVGGETCEPPNDPLICDARCHSLQPASCRNGIQDGTESDIDCGGADCAACLSGGICFSPRDCRAAHPDCMGFADCPVTASGVCQESTLCADGDQCTDDACDVSGGCLHPLLDHDGDGHAPSSNGCGDDCNDRNPHVFLDAAELCDGIDNDCDETIDETCT